MACDKIQIMMGDPGHGTGNHDCPVQNWCVCQWAFSSYLEKAGGCNKIKEIVCEAINIEAIIAYEKSDNIQHKIALDCITQRCEL